MLAGYDSPGQLAQTGHTKATITLGRGLTRCPRIEHNTRNRQSAPDWPQSRGVPTHPDVRKIAYAYCRNRL